MSYLPRTAALSLAGIVVLLSATPAVAQEPEPDPEYVEQAQIARRGAGLRIGMWALDTDDEDEAVADADEWPYLEGYFQRGLDRHLAIESTLGLQRRTIQEESGGIIGEPTTTEVTAYVVPLLTAIKLYPLTGPEDRVEPYVAAGGGFAFGIEDGEGTGIQTGFGLKGEAGLEVRFSQAFGLGLRGGYQWIRFGDEIGGLDTYKGFGGGIGLTYRFQY